MANPWDNDPVVSAPASELQPQAYVRVDANGHMPWENDPVGHPQAEQSSTFGDIVKSAGSGIVQGATSLAGLPGTIGDAFNNSMSAILGMKPLPSSQLSGQSLSKDASIVTGGATDYKPQTTAGQYAHTAGEFVPGALALGGADTLLGMGANAVKMGVIPGVTSEGAGQATKGTAAEPYARFAGAVFSPAAVAAGEHGVNALVDAVTSYSPKIAAAKNLEEALATSGKTSADVQAAMAANPRLNAMDVNPNLQQMGMNLATQGGAPRAILNDVVQGRMAGAKDAVNGAFDDAMGQTPDTVKMLTDLRARQAASVMTPADVKATLDTHMGAATDPHTAIQDFVKQRSAQSQPAYEAALQGGSVAPLEHQFQSAFSDATSAVTQASKDLAAAQQRQLLASAQISRAGDNVYGASGAQAASRDAQSAVAEAQKNLAAATAQKDSNLVRLRRAQEDGSANAPGAVWSPRIQQFLDEPIMQTGLAKGAKIQRLESLAEGKPFNPSEYAIKGADEAGNPIVASVPNMRTLNVAKKGLDAMVAEAKDPITGRLSEEGRAIDRVRSSFLDEIDKINPDYKAARDAWAGPSRVMDAFKKGLGLFQNKSGMAGIDNSPEAIASFVKGATPDEIHGLKMGGRASLEQQMLNSSGDQVDKVTRIANVEANQRKLSTLIGDKPAKDIVSGLNAQHLDPVGDAFSKGLDIFRNRAGSAGLEDRPEFLQQWKDGASAHEIEAARQGTRVAADNQINSVRAAAAKGVAIPEVGFNRAKMEILLGKPETDKLAQSLAHEKQIAETNARLFAGSQTAPRAAISDLTSVTKVNPGSGIGTSMAGMLLGHELGGPWGMAGGLALGGVKSGGQMALRYRDNARNAIMAKAISGDAPGLQKALSAAPSGPLLSPTRLADPRVAAIVAALLASQAGQTKPQPTR